MKYKGTPEDLETIVTALGRTISKSSDTGTMHQIKTEEGITLNLFRNETLQFQGKADVKSQFEHDFNSYNGTIAPATKTPAVAMATETTQVCASSGKQVFIVHGHDDTSREQLELVLHKLGLD